MPQQVWRKIIERQKIPEAEGVAWTKVLDSVTPGKLMKIQVVVDDKANPVITGKWKPADFHNECTADGDFSGSEPGQKQAGTALLACAPLGALIGRIGGSTADLTADPGASPTRIVFSIGRECIFSVPSSPLGALYMGVNDSPTNMIRLANALFVDVFEAL